MKFSLVINSVILALTSVVSAQNICSSKITDKGYKCCSDNCVTTYSDEDGNWAIENNKWCGCGNGSNCSINIIKKGYKCCPKNCEVVYTDDDGTWGIHNNKWCGCSLENTDVNDQDINNADEPNTNEPNTEDDGDYVNLPDDITEEELKAMIEEYEKRILDVTSDEKEIEKKWLINGNSLPFDFTRLVGTVINIKQTYICFDPEIRVREYTDKNGLVIGHEMTIKTNLTEDGLIRDETNININQEQYDNMIKKQEGNSIFKTRYQFLYKGEIIAIDIFHEDLNGLAYMEIEFATKEESDAYETPDWVIKDVTDDIRYKNGHLARYGIPNPQ